MSDPAETDATRLKRLEDRIAAARADKQEKPHQETHYSQANLAWRMVIELVAGLSIGFGIGYGLDILFGTTPVLMILFILLGFVAGIKAVLRSAQELQNKTAAGAAAEGDDQIGR